METITAQDIVDAIPSALELLTERNPQWDRWDREYVKAYQTMIYWVTKGGHVAVKCGTDVGAMARTMVLDMVAELVEYNSPKCLITDETGHPDVTWFIL